VYKSQELIHIKVKLLLISLVTSFKLDGST
jgi:hypothetical protein